MGNGYENLLTFLGYCCELEPGWSLGGVTVSIVLQGRLPSVTQAWDGGGRWPVVLSRGYLTWQHLVICSPDTTSTMMLWQPRAAAHPVFSHRPDAHSQLGPGDLAVSNLQA